MESGCCGIQRWSAANNSHPQANYGISVSVSLHVGDLHQSPFPLLRALRKKKLDRQRKQTPRLCSRVIHLHPSLLLRQSPLFPYTPPQRNLVPPYLFCGCSTEKPRYVDLIHERRPTFLLSRQHLGLLVSALDTSLFTVFLLFSRIALAAPELAELHGGLRPDSGAGI